MSAIYRKSTQVHARPGQTKSQVDPSFQLASTCESVWPGLNIQVDIVFQKLQNFCVAKALMTSL